MHCALDVKTGDAVVWRFESTRKCVHKIVSFGFSVPIIQQLSEEEEVALSTAIVVIFSFVCFCLVLSSDGPFTAEACKNSGLNDTRTRLQTVYFPVL